MYDFGKCVRQGSISTDEVHPCYFCGREVKVSNPIHCNICHMWKCSFCGACYCDASEGEQELLIKMHETYCRNYDNLIGFYGVADESIKVSDENNGFFNNICNAILNCAEMLRCQDR
jgi:hypothetical protein